MAYIPLPTEVAGKVFIFCGGNFRGVSRLKMLWRKHLLLATPLIGARFSKNCPFPCKGIPFLMTFEHFLKNLLENLCSPVKIPRHMTTLLYIIGSVQNIYLNGKVKCKPGDYTRNRITSPEITRKLKMKARRLHGNQKMMSFTSRIRNIYATRIGYILIGSIVRFVFPRVNNPIDNTIIGLFLRVLHF